MEGYKSGLSSEEIEKKEFEEDFHWFKQYMTEADWAKIYKCVDIVLDERKNSGSQSPPNDTPALPLASQPEDVTVLPATQNSINVTWPTANTSTLCLQNDVPPKNDKCSPIHINPIQILENAFSSSIYINGKKRRVLAELLDMSEGQVSCWFDNRRRRMRRESETNDILIDQPLKYAGGYLAVKQESFDMDYVRSSNLSREGNAAVKVHSVLPTSNSENTSPNTNIENHGSCNKTTRNFFGVSDFYSVTNVDVLHAPYA